MPSKFYTCKESPNKGLKIKIKRVDPADIAAASAAFSIPDPPTYFAQTVTGSYEELPISDMETAKQVDGGVERYNHYLQRKENELRKQGLAIARTMFLDGCDFTIPKWNWETRDRFKGLQIPVDLDLKKVFYLENHIKGEDIASLLSEIMALAGVGEEAIQLAEETFRNAIRPNQPDSDEEGDSTDGVET